MKILRRTTILGLLICYCFCIQAKITLRNRFEGITGKMLKNVESRLDIEQQAAVKDLTVNDVKRLNHTAPHEISLALQPYGYFKPKITSRVFNIGDDWYAVYNIDLGEPLKITKLDIKIIGAASKDQKFKKLLTRIPLKEGDILEIDPYNKTKQMFFDLANRRGYLAAKMQQSVVRIDLDNDTSEVILHFDSGPRYFFGPVTFSKSALSEKFLTRFLTFIPGEYYSGNKIQSTHQAFNDSGLFQSAVVHTKTEAAKNSHAPIHIEAIPRKSRQYNFGFGYGTDTGVRGLVQMNLYNLTSTGHYFQTILKASALSPKEGQGSWENHYMIPGRNPATDKYDISGALKASNIQNEEVKYNITATAGIAYMKLIKGWQQTLKVNLQRDWFETDEEGKQVSTLLIPGASWVKTKSNDLIRPTKGYRLYFLTQGASKALLSDVNFIQWRASAKLIQPLIKRYTFLVMRGELGYIFTNAADKLPPSVRFFAGGAQSIRGFAYKDIGPGQSLDTASIELRQKIYGNWYGAIFLDAGNASDKFLSRPFINRSVGIGIVWLSPIGAMQLSYARNMIQFNMGVEL